MERQKKVLDASVLIKWFSQEENTEKAIELREQYIQQTIEILIPELAFLEVINSLRYKKKNEEELKKIIKNFLDLQIGFVALTEDLLNKTLKVALENNLTIYDSLYVAIAQFHGCPLITADKELYKIPNVIPLEKYD